MVEFGITCELGTPRSLHGTQLMRLLSRWDELNDWGQAQSVRAQWPSGDDDEEAPSCQALTAGNTTVDDKAALEESTTAALKHSLAAGYAWSYPPRTLSRCKPARMTCNRGRSCQSWSFIWHGQGPTSFAEGVHWARTRKNRMQRYVTRSRPQGFPRLSSYPSLSHQVCICCGP